MKRTFTIIAMALLLSAGIQAAAQEKWTLQQCIDYALENNIQIKQQNLAVEYQKNQLEQAKSNRLPNLNGQIGNNYNFGRSLTYQNTYENTNSTSISGYLGTDVTIWNGKQMQNLIRQRDLDLKATMQDYQKAKNDLILNIAAMYLEILYSEELIGIDENQMTITNQQIERSKKLMESGRLAKGALFESEAQLAAEELQLVTDQNRAQIAFLNLYQLLELPLEKYFKIDKPEFPDIQAGGISFNSQSIFSNAVQTRPEILASQLRVESAQRQLDQARGSRWPRLSFGASYYNNFNDNYLRIKQSNPTETEVIPFGEQLSNNQRYGFGLTLTVPIFNQFQVKNGISNATLQIEDYKYRLQTSKNSLQKDIEQAYTNALSAMKRYVSSQKAVKSSTEAFRYAEEKLNVGTVTTVEYNQVKNNLTAAQAQLSQAKYEYIFRSKILDFYNGIPIKL
jgi:outer membrane protein